MRPTAAGAAGLRGRCHGRSPRRASASAVTAASLRPTPLPPTVISRSQPSPSSACAIDAPSRPSASVLTTSGAGGARALSDQIGRHGAAGNIDDAQPRPAHHQCLSPAARAIRRSRASTRRPARATSVPSAMSLPARRTPCPGIASASTCASRARLDRPESQSTTQSQPSGMASPASTQAGDVRQRQRRVRRRADEIVRAQRPAVARRRCRAAEAPATAASGCDARAARPASGRFDRRHRREPAQHGDNAPYRAGVSEAGRRWDVTMAPRMYPIARQIYSRLVALSGP